MRIREFTGADYEGLARLLGACRHAARGERSYWYGADDLCEALAASDAAIVLEDEGVPKGVVVLRGAGESPANRELSSHWLQQRMVIGAVSRSLGFDARRDEDATASEPPARLAGACEGERPPVVLFELAADAPEGATGKIGRAHV